MDTAYTNLIGPIEGKIRIMIDYELDGKPEAVEVNFREISVKSRHTLWNGITQAMHKPVFLLISELGNTKKVEAILLDGTYLK